MEERRKSFDPSSSRYKCCCGCHVTTVILFIFVLGLIGTILSFFLSIPTGLGVALIILMPYCVALIGIEELRPDCLAPMMIIWFMNIALSVVWITEACRISSFEEEKIGVAICVCNIAFHTWCTYIAIRCWQYLKGMAALREEEKSQSKESSDQQETSEFIV